MVQVLLLTAGIEDRTNFKLIFLHHLSLVELRRLIIFGGRGGHKTLVMLFLAMSSIACTLELSSRVGSVGIGHLRHIVSSTGMITTSVLGLRPSRLDVLVASIIT